MLSTKQVAGRRGGAAQPRFPTSVRLQCTKNAVRRNAGGLGVPFSSLHAPPPLTKLRNLTHLPIGSAIRMGRYMPSHPLSPHCVVQKLLHIWSSFSNPKQFNGSGFSRPAHIGHPRRQLNDHRAYRVPLTYDPSWQRDPYVWYCGTELPDERTNPSLVSFATSFPSVYPSTVVIIMPMPFQPRCYPSRARIPPARSSSWVSMHMARQLPRTNLAFFLGVRYNPFQRSLNALSIVVCLHLAEARVIYYWCMLCSVLQQPLPPLTILLFCTLEEILFVEILYCRGAGLSCLPRYSLYASPTKARLTPRQPSSLNIENYNR